jgi:hypothetical protein
MTRRATAVALREQPAPTAALVLDDGSRAEIRAGALELRDAEQRLLVRFVDGAAEIFAPSRDLKLAAPHGRVILQAATDVSLEAGRDLTQHAARRLELGVNDGAQQLALEPGRTHLRAGRLEIEAKDSRLATGTVTLMARSIATTAERMAHDVERYELRAGKLVEKARDTLREVTGLCELKLGRARTVVAGTFGLRTRRTVLESQDDTSIDGKRVLLG